MSNIKNNKVKNLDDNIFKPQVLLQTIISDLERLKQRVDSSQKALSMLRKDLVKSGVLKIAT